VRLLRGGQGREVVSVLIRRGQCKIIMHNWLELLLQLWFAQLVRAGKIGFYASFKRGRRSFSLGLESSGFSI
jgi:hypothetical protein